MFLGNTINLFIGLALTFGTVALAVSTITEGISSLLKLRSKTLLDGVKNILNDRDLQKLAGAVLTHAAVNPLLALGATPAELSKKNTPSYIPSQQFATAIIDVLTSQGNGDIKAGIDQLDHQLCPLFSGMLCRTTDNGIADLEAFRLGVAAWFDSSMERLSGDYKRWALAFSFVAGIALAAALNIDSCAIANTLWSDPQLSMGITQAPSDGHSIADAASAVSSFNQLHFPFGWSAANVPPSPLAAAIKFAGWVLTATAALFGAPFWFDLLQRFVQLRGTGTAPDPVWAAAAQARTINIATSPSAAVVATPSQVSVTASLPVQTATPLQLVKPATVDGGIAWFKNNFGDCLKAGLSGTPFSVDLLSAIAVQETYEIWGSLYNTHIVADILPLCVGDTLDYPKRSAFPKTKGDLIQHANGQAIFDIARQALADIGGINATYQKVFFNYPDKFCHGFGIFQYDLQHFAENPHFFLNREWLDFEKCLALCVDELNAAKAKVYGTAKTTLSANEMIYVAIAYNCGSADIHKDFKQGYGNEEDGYYGELIAKYIDVSQRM